jgi:polysaccharide deacetylase family protein (PEP-CTERM system associated)
MDASKITNALTVDVEDYFHVSAFSETIDRSSWDTRESRVEKNTQTVLQLFDDAGVKATFFVLGWVAERYPQLVREIASQGHEIACHGFSHELIYNQKQHEFRDETVRAKEILESITGQPVAGYRAASFSITDESRWALDVLCSAGFGYDSSIVPASHDVYGMTGAAAFPYRISVPESGSLVEFPPSTIPVLGRRIPIGGGGYFRLFPYWFTRFGLRRINNTDRRPFTFYMHPWEIDPEQPRIPARWKSRFRHYNNLEKFQPRLVRLLQEFRFNTMASVLSDLSEELRSDELVSTGSASTQGTR